MNNLDISFLQGNRMFRLLHLAARTAQSAVASVQVTLAFSLIAFVVFRPIATQRQAGDAEITAERFTLRDNQGRVRGRWKISADDKCEFDLYDVKGAVRTSISVRSDGTPSVQACDDEGKKRLKCP